MLSVVCLAPAIAMAEHDDVLVEPIPLGEASFALELVTAEIGTSVGAAYAPFATTQLFIVEQQGLVTALGVGASNFGDRHVMLDVGPEGADLLVSLKTEGFDERGLIGLAFDPHYRKTGRFYTYTSERLGPEPDFTTLAAGESRRNDASLSVIREWRVDDPRRSDAVADPESSRVLLRIEQPQPNHNGGALAFGRDGMLYIALGDGGSRDDEGLGHSAGGNGQDLSEQNLLGKILRIDPRGTTSGNGSYGIPADNPFAGAVAGADEVYAYGFRNPYRMTFDHGTGDLIAGDVGQRDIEEIDVVVAGGNYGWPVKEGTFLFDNRGPTTRGVSAANSPGEPVGMIDPIAQYDHDEGTSVTAGFVYRGSALPELTGTYVFGDLTRNADLIAGRFFQIDGDGQLVELIASNAADNRLLITGFGQDTQGELYVVGLQPRDGRVAGVVYRLVPGEATE